MTHLRASALAWLCCLAIAVQCVVVQSHVHLTAADLSQAEAAADAGAADIASKSTDKSKPPAPANCFLCQQAAMTGLDLPPVSPEPILIERVEAAQPPAIELALVTPQVSHSWLSRGPPISSRV